MNRRNFLKSIGLASAGVIVAGSISSLVLPSIKKAAKPIMAVKVNGKTYWYDLEMEKALTKWMEDQEKLIGMYNPPPAPDTHRLSFLDFSS